MIIKGLIDGFADLEVEGSITSTKSPLHYAAEIGSMVLIDALLLPFKFCRYRMANVSNSIGQTALFPLLLNLDMSKKDNDPDYNDKIKSNSENRMKLLIRFIQVGLSFSHADNNNLSVLHYLKKNIGSNDTHTPNTSNGSVTMNRENRKSIEIKYILNNLSSLFIRDGKTAIRKQTVAISKSKYTKFHQKLNGLLSDDIFSPEASFSPTNRLSKKYMNEFVNDTYIYKCFLGIDDSDFISGEVFDSIDSNGDGQDGDEPHTIHRKHSASNETEHINIAVSRAEKNVCHVIFADGSVPKYDLYFPLSVGKLLFFPNNDLEKTNIIHQTVFPINDEREDIQFLYNTTMEGIEDMWHNFDPYRRLDDHNVDIGTIQQSQKDSAAGNDNSLKNPLINTRPDIIKRDRSQSFEDDDAIRRVIVSYINNRDILKDELNTLIYESEYNSLKKLSIEHGLTEFDIEAAEAHYTLAVKCDAREDFEEFIHVAPDRRSYLTTFIFCKRLGFDPQKTFKQFYTNFRESENEKKEQKKKGETATIREENIKNSAFNMFKRAMFNQWTRLHSMSIEFFDSEVGKYSISRSMSNTRYGNTCWGIDRKKIIETRQFLMQNKYVKLWKVRNMKIMCEGEEMDYMYVRNRRLIEMYGMLRVIHGRYVLESIESEFALYLACAKFEGMCKHVEDFFPSSVESIIEKDFNLKRLEKVKDKINLEYVAYLGLVRERSKRLEAEHFEKKYERYIEKIKKSFKDQQKAVAAIEKHERFFSQQYGTMFAMEKFEQHCFQRYASGPHSISLHYKDVVSGKIENVSRKRTGMWRSQKLYESELEEDMKVSAGKRQSRSNTAAYFLREVVRTALDAGCGNEVCSCVNEIGCNLLEILEAAPNLTEVFGKESQPTLSLIYQNLLLAASKYANEKKATRLIEVLISKRVNVRKLATNPRTNPLNFAADRRMLRGSSILIKAGATVTVNALEALFNALEGQAYYEKRITLEPEVEESERKLTSELSAIRASLSRKVSFARSRHSKKLTRTLSKQHVDALFKQDGEDVKSILRKQVLFHGAESGTLTSDILHYMLEDSMSHSTNDFDVCDTDEYGATAMHYASMNGHHRTIMVLAEAGGRNCMSMRDDNLRQTIRDLVYFKPLPHDKTNYLRGYAGKDKAYRRRTITAHHYKYRGYTPLALAIQNGHVECVRVLLDLGADPFLRDVNKATPNPHLIDPTCPYWLSLGIRLPMEKKLSPDDPEVIKAMSDELDLTFVCALNQKTTRRPRIKAVEGYDTALQRSHGRRSVMDAHFKGQLDSILLLEQRSRRKRRSYKKYVTQWYDNILKDGVRAILDSRIEEHERSLVNYGSEDGMKKVDLNLSTEGTNDSISQLMTESHFSNRLSKRESINNLMRKHPAVHLMRSRYGTSRFYIYLVFYILNLFFPMVFCIFLLNAGEGVNRMRTRTEREMLANRDRPELYGFDMLKENRDNFYDWLEHGLMGKVFPALSKKSYDEDTKDISEYTYIQVGMPLIQIQRMRDKFRRWNSTFFDYQDVKEPTGTFGSVFTAFNYSTDSWGGSTSRASYNCQANRTRQCVYQLNDTNFDAAKKSYKFFLTKNFTSDIAMLKKNNFLDKYTYHVEVRFVFFSLSTGSYCQTRIQISYQPDKLIETRISYYVFTSSIDSFDIDRDSEERRLAPKFQHVCLAMFAAIMMNELASLILGYYWSCRGPCIKLRKEFEQKRRGDTFWDKEMEEFEMEENENLVIGRGRGISVVNRTRVRKDDGKVKTPWERKVDRSRRKSAKKLRDQLKQISTFDQAKHNRRSMSRVEQLTSTPKSIGRKGFKRAKSTNEQIGNVDIENLNKKSELRNVEMTTVTTSPPSPKKKNRAKLKFNEKTARISTSISSNTTNLRTTLRRNMQNVLQQATDTLNENHMDQQAYKLSLRDLVELWWLRCLIAYKHNNILQLIYVSVGIVLLAYIGIFLILVESFKQQMKNKSQFDTYLEAIDSAVEVNQFLRVLFVIFTFALTVKIASFAKVHPVFGKFTLAIGKVISSNSITHFLVLYLLFYSIMMLCYHVMFGDVVYDFRDFTNTAMALVRLGITGEHEYGSMVPENSPYFNTPLIPNLILIVFMLLAVLFALNLFIAILTAEWSQHIELNLWDTEIESELCRHVEYNHAGLIFEKNPLLSYFLRVWRDQHVVCCTHKIPINCFSKISVRKSSREEIELLEESMKDSKTALDMDRKSRYSRLRAISFSGD